VDRSRDGDPPATDSSCCDGTGYADYAAVPCPNPRCPVPQPRPTDSGATQAPAPGLIAPTTKETQ
jgi:hypothetical protein